MRMKLLETMIENIQFEKDVSTMDTSSSEGKIKKTPKYFKLA